jgi:hypothetical protein
MTAHRPNCPLELTQWLRHATAAVGVLAQNPMDDLTDRDSAMALADTIALLVELGQLTVTLEDVAEQALGMMDEEKIVDMCECGAAGD